MLRRNAMSYRVYKTIRYPLKNTIPLRNRKEEDAEHYRTNRKARRSCRLLRIGSSKLVGSAEYTRSYSTRLDRSKDRFPVAEDECKE